MSNESRKPLEWEGTARSDLRQFPREVRIVVGYGLLLAQEGKKHPDAKPLTGFGDAQVLEVSEDFDRCTYRVIYTVRFEEAVYVLNAFKKKSRHGIATAKSEIDLAKIRLKQVEGRRTRK